MTPEMVNELSSAVLKVLVALISVLVSAVIVPWLKGTVVPYLKEKRLYSLCVKFVQAAEKLYESGIIPNGEAKKAYVERMLANAGVEITPEISALIESAVKDLDLAMGKIGDVFEEESETADDAQKTEG